MANNSRTVKAYDNVNAGQDHCFTVSRKLVHNCGYGGWAEALIAMGGLDAKMKEDALEQLMKAWCAVNTNIVQFCLAEHASVRFWIVQEAGVLGHDGAFHVPICKGTFPKIGRRRG